MAQIQTPEMKSLQSSVAMTVALISWGMLFATLFLGYFLVRFNTPVWPPVELDGLPQLIPFLSTAVMLLSSVTYYGLEKQVDQRKKLWPLTFLLGLGFLALQWRLWNELQVSGILVSHGMVPSMLYAFTWLHAAHILLGLLALLWVGHYIYRGPEEVSGLLVKNVGLFWHFLGLVWIIMYLMMFVL